MDKFYKSDFDVVISDENGHWVKIKELNKMIECEVISINEEKLEQYYKDRAIKQN